MFVNRIVAGVLCPLFCIVAGGWMGAEDEKPEPTIRDVMRTGMRGSKGLFRRVVNGNATEAERRELVTMLKSLENRRPPKGDVDSWRKRVGTIVGAAEKVVDGNDRDDRRELLVVGNCAACHRVHRPTGRDR